MVTFLRILFLHSGNRAYVVMVEMEPVLLPQSTSPKTRIWVSQARPCQEQPALFGSLERLGQNAAGEASRAPAPRSGAHAGPGSGLRRAGRLGVPPRPRVPESRERSLLAASWRSRLWSVLSGARTACAKRDSCLQFCSEAVKDAKRNIQVSCCFEPDHVKTKENPCLLAWRAGVTNYFLSTKKATYKGQTHGEKVKCVGILLKSGLWKTSCWLCLHFPYD